MIGFSRLRILKRRACSLSWIFEAGQLADSLTTITTTWTLRITCRRMYLKTNRYLREGEWEAESMPIGKPRLRIEHTVYTRLLLRIANGNTGNFDFLSHFNIESS